MTIFKAESILFNEAEAITNNFLFDTLDFKVIVLKRQITVGFWFDWNKACFTEF